MRISEAIVNLNDQDAISQSLDGHVEAFEKIVQRYSGPIFRYAYKWLRDQNLSEDIVQETFLRAYRSLKEGKKVPQVSSWLFGIAKNCCLETIRQKGRMPQSLQDKDSPVNSESGKHGVEEYLEELDDFSKALVYLKHVNGMTCEEIATSLGRPLGTVTGVLTRAYKKIKDLIKERKS